MAESPTTKGLPALAREVRDLVVAYLKQETVVPVKQLGRFLAFGLGGSVLLSIGLVLLALAGLRALQTETGSTFTGKLSWAPYGITLVGTGAASALGVRAIASHKRKANKRSAT